MIGCQTIRHAHNPFYSQTFVTELQREDMKDISVVLAVMDQDRWLTLNF